MDTIFIGLSWLVVAACIFHSMMFWHGGAWCASSTRWKWAALPIGLPCLVWCAWHGCLMLEGPLAAYHPIVWILVPVLAVLSCFFIDYLFARTCGGFLILAANELLRRGFGNDIAMRPLFSTVCLLLGIAGLFMVGVPWKLRILLENYAGKQPGRIIAIALWLCSLALALLPFFCHNIK